VHKLSGPRVGLLHSILVLSLLLAPAGVYAAYIGPLRSTSGPGPSGGMDQPVSVASGDPGRVVLVLATATTWDQFHQAVTEGTLSSVAERLADGALGLMNTNTARYRLADDAYVTVGAGTRARDYAHYVHQADDTVHAEAIYRRRMGSGPGGARVVHLGLAPLNRANDGVDHTVVVGALGQALNEAAVPVAVLGNADLPGEPHRGVVAVAMDTEGRVPWGLVGSELLIRDEAAPAGVRSNWERLWQEYQALPFDSGLVVVEAGDFVRLDSVADELTPGQVEHHRRLGWERLNRFLHRLQAELELSTDLLLLASIAPDHAGEKEQDALTPVYALGRGITPGLLSTDTTRRPGLLANVDLAPTILAHFDVARPAAMLGAPLQSSSRVIRTGMIGAWGGFLKPAQQADVGLLEVLDAKHNYTLFNHNRRWPYLLQPYIVAYLGALAVAAWVIFRAKVYSPVAVLTLGIMTIPLVLFVLPLVPLPSGWLTFTVTLSATALLTRLLTLLRRVHIMLPLTVLGILTASIVAADVASGGQLMTTSPLGYSPIVGARYYGIGNEYMGILLGSVLMGLCAFADYAQQRLQQRHASVVLQGLILAGFCGAFYLVASPALGANLGGTAAAAVGFSIAGMRMSRGQVNLRTVSLAGAAAAGAVILLGAWDLSRPIADQTHIGHAFGDILATNGRALVDIAQRKVAMNLRLFRFTLWSRVLVASILVFVALVYRPVGTFRRVTSRFPFVIAGLHGIAALTVVAFVVNDSGVVFGALSMLYGVSTLIYLVVSELEERLAAR